jgi:hypothetical protein
MRRYENGRGIAARLNLMTVREILEAVGVIFVEENGKARAGAAQGGEMSLTDKFTARGAFLIAAFLWSIRRCTVSKTTLG